MTQKLQDFYNKNLYKTKAAHIEEVVSEEELKRSRWFLKNTKINIKNAKICELGCSVGTFYSLLKKGGVSSKNYIGIDIGDSAKEGFARFFPEDNNLFQEDFLGFLNKHDEKFDCIIAMAVLEHLPNDYLLGVTQAVKEHLSEEGEFWVSVPCAESIISSYIQYSDLTHFWRFALQNFRDLGFSIQAKTGKLVHVDGAKSFVRFLHNKTLYVLNRVLFATTIGRKAELGVFSDEVHVILKNKQ